jgi:signal transduction histidine kinase
MTQDEQQERVGSSFAKHGLMAPSLPKGSSGAHGMPSPPVLGKSQRSSTAELARRWAGHVALAAAVGAAYLLVAQVTVLGIAFQPDKTALFWPAAGISSGLLIALGPRRRWPAVAGIMAAEAAAAQLSWHNPWVTAVMAVCDTVEALTVAGLVARYFGDTDFALDRARNVFGLLGAAVVAAAAPSLGVAVVKSLLLDPSIMILPTWQRWFAGDVLGIVAVAPLVIGLFGALRHPPSRREYVEGTLGLLSLAIVTSIIVLLPRKAWDVLLPVGWPFPILLWLAARTRPVFAAAGAFLVSSIIVWTTIFGMGRFGNASVPIDDRVLEAQTAILFLAVGAYVLAALFAERRGSEALLARSNTMLQRERDNKLMNAEATAASIAHELKQPLAAMGMNADASLVLLEQTSPNLPRVKNALNNIVADVHRTGKALDGIRALFRTVNQGWEPVDVGEICSEVLRSLRAELNDHGISVESELSSKIPPIQGNRGQLQQVIFNLVHNAVEAMTGTTSQKRMLRLVTQRSDRDRIVVSVQDTGPGIVPEQLDHVFDAFMTTKPQGMGLGLAICQIIVERHGGELTVLSDGKEGALFQFSLPIKSSDEGAAGH